MKLEEYEAFLGESVAPPSLDVIEFTDQSDRTLVLGYDFDRVTVHVFMRHGMIHLVEYTGTNPAEPLIYEESSSLWEEAAVLCPPKRSYPEYTDLEFARLIRSKGLSLNFTGFEENAKPGPFFGRTY